MKTSYTQMISTTTGDSLCGFSVNFKLNSIPMYSSNISCHRKPLFVDETGGAIESANQLAKTNRASSLIVHCYAYPISIVLPFSVSKVVKMCNKKYA